MITNAKILIVDDNKQNRQILEELVKNLGHESVLAENGKIALEKLKKDKFDLILLDIIMPELDGYQTLELIKKDQNLKYIPSIMITTIDEIDSIVKCLKLGADDYILKPFEPEILKARINNSLVKLELYLTEKELLEKTLTGSLKILIDILTTNNYHIYGKSTRVRRLVKLMAEKMDIENKWNLEMAAMLSQIGCITVPSEILDRVAIGKTLTPNETIIYKNHAIIGHKILQNLPRLEKVADIIKYQNKNYDGSGVPEDEVKDVAIPVESRILRVALDYDTINYLGINPLKSLEKLKETRNLYDVTILNILEHIVLNENQKEIKALKITQLDYGMILAEDVVTIKNVKIAGKGQEISYPMMTRLRNMSKTTKINEPIKVIILKTWTSI